MGKRELRDYPSDSGCDNAQCSCSRTVHEEHLNEGLLVYVQRLRGLNTNPDAAFREIEVAGYRHTSYFKPTRVKLIPKEKQGEIESSLTKILNSHPIYGDVPISDFFFWH